ncbi:MAG: transposase, partial [Elusimicrobia bacterium]|nr:transposase [Elusimicrobiota bacterium]
DSEHSLVRYRMKKGDSRASPGTVREGRAYTNEPAVLEWDAVEFVRRFAELVPPPRKHLVRYCGALGPRSSLRRAVTDAAREKVPFDALLAGVSCAAPAASRAGRMITRAARAIGARARSWAACLRRVFEAEPILCPQCLVEMKPIAAITRDCDLERLLRGLELPADFPKTAPARSPPRATAEETQVDPRAEAWDGIDEGPQPDWAAA